MKCVRYILIAILCVSFTGCNNFGGIKYKNITTEEKNETYSMYTETPEISGIENKEFSENVNTYFKNLNRTWTEDFKSRIPEKNSNRAEFSAISDLKTNKNDFISTVTEKNVFLGGAHGNMWKYSANIDVKYSKLLELKDLFIDNKYIEFINCRIQELIKEKPREYSDLWQKPELGDRQQKDFYIHDGNLVIYYQPYDLSYYAKGFVEFPISIKSLTGYIKPEYIERLG